MDLEQLEALALGSAARRGDTIAASMSRVIVIVAALAAGCAKRPDPSPGTERGACYGNGTCNDGLLCLSARCVRPPPADCAAVAEAVASLELGTYAAREGRAPRVAELADRCRAEHVSQDEGACLIAATTVVEATFCPKPLLAPSRGPVTLGIPEECTRYARVLERIASCAALPEESRATYREHLAQLRRSWDSQAASAMTAAQVQACVQGRTALEQAMPRMGCP
jgi:hypothetical protein